MHVFAQGIASEKELNQPVAELDNRGRSMRFSAPEKPSSRVGTEARTIGPRGPFSRDLKTPMHRYRSHTCGALRPANVGESVRISGWVHRVRDHGGLLFIDLRDHYGLPRPPGRTTALQEATA